MKGMLVRAVFFLSALALTGLLSFGFGLYSGWFKTGGYAFGSFMFRSAKTVYNENISDARTVKHSFSPPGLIRESDFVDPGFLLLAAYFPEKQRAGIRLLRLRDGLVVKEWYPDPQAIRDASTLPDLYPPSRFQPKSPILLPDGGLIFIDEPGPLVRIDACSQVRYVVDDKFHHSLSLDLDQNFVVPIKLRRKNIVDSLDIVDDGVAVVTPTGEIIQKVSVFEMMEENGLVGLVLGSGLFDEDPIHLNDVKVAERTGDHWQRGDWLLSLRNQSVIILYRPSTGKVVWVHHGPWLRQHDPNFLEGGRRISVFGNDVIDTPSRTKIFYNGTSQLYVFEPDSRWWEEPFADVLRAENIGTPTQGRANILENGDLFVEETDRGRLMRVSSEGVVWRYHNVDGEEAGLLNWSRYLPSLPKELAVINNLECAESLRVAMGALSGMGATPLDE